MSHTTKIADLLGTIIEQADDTLKQQLAQAIEDFAEQRTPAFKSVHNTPYSKALLEAMTVAADVRIDAEIMSAMM